MSKRNSRKPSAAAQEIISEQQPLSAESFEQKLPKKSKKNFSEEKNPKEIVSDGNATDLLAGQLLSGTEMSSVGVTPSKNMATDLDFCSQKSESGMKKLLHFPAPAIG